MGSQDQLTTGGDRQTALPAVSSQARVRGASLVGRKVASRCVADAMATVVTDGRWKIRVGATVVSAAGQEARERSASQWEAANTEADGAPSETGCGWGSGQWEMGRGGRTKDVQMGQVSGALDDALEVQGGSSTMESIPWDPRTN